ncbi:SURF1 family protein [Microbaculum marinum]|uniref:SURF1-like protein n=1 Tax=Microbaculum marinum TaxID=1764581 RepID=A0AAW9RS46_9HYPH
MPAWRKVALTGLLVLVAFAILCGLGIWQMQRLAWKNGLIAMVEERVEKPAVPLPEESEWPAVNREEDEYRKVTLSGEFRHDLEAPVFTTLDDPKFGLNGAGYWILTPLRLPDGSIVMVNRGFVPIERKDPATRPEGQVDGEVDVTGLLRMPERGNLFTPDADPGANAWFVRDPASIAEARNLDRVAPFFIDADATPNPGGLPIGGTTRVQFRNDHLGYALTWFGLALALGVVFAVWAAGQLRQNRNLAGHQPRQ